MSDNIPFEIQVEIMKRLPVKSLIQFRSVSKQWKSLIDGSEFIANYNHNQTQHHLLVSYADPQDNFNRKYVSIVDDDTFPQLKFPLTVPVSVQQLHMPPVFDKTRPTMLGSSQGLFCFYNFLRRDDPLRNIAVIWNPAIRKSVDVVVPNVSDMDAYDTFLAFGVCPRTNDPKLVKVTFATDDQNDFPWEVEVFTLSSGVWRSPKSSNLPTKMTGLVEDGDVVIDGFIYWPSYEKYNSIFLIMSFDLTSEEFVKVYLPDSLSVIEAPLSLSKLRDSLVVLRSSYKDHVPLFDCSVWMMENGDPKSFTKIFTITPLDDFIREVLGFRKSGEAIIEVIEEEHDALCVYEHESEHINHIWFSGKKFSLFASCYMETLLLLDHRGCSI